jgi:hypothetical protein
MSLLGNAMVAMAGLGHCFVGMSGSIASLYSTETTQHGCTYGNGQWRHLIIPLESANQRHCTAPRRYHSFRFLAPPEWLGLRLWWES